MIRAQASRSLAAATRATPAAARVATVSRARMYASFPDPTHPTDKPKPNDVPTPPKDTGNALTLIVAGTAVLIGGWWYMQQKDDPHAKRLKDQAELEQKAAQAKEAGKATAHDVVREGEANYEATKAVAKDKLNQARAEADSAAADVKASTVHDATRKAEATYDEARRAAADAAHKVEAETQSWGQWFGSWFGYGKTKVEQTADDAKREAARQVAAGAEKVETEAKKRA